MCRRLRDAGFPGTNNTVSNSGKTGPKKGKLTMKQAETARLKKQLASSA
ncbi:hypothetical protein GCM10010038_34340 [Glutamicibacter protophormiae]|nr:hypothetical protein GCM10010038_34340 [Glutamicibacter protophormiae]